jgi:hypothetical protein
MPIFCSWIEVWPARVRAETLQPSVASFALEAMPDQTVLILKGGGLDRDQVIAKRRNRSDEPAPVLPQLMPVKAQLPELLQLETHI